MKLVLSTSLMGIVILASAGTTMRPQYSGFFNGGSDGLSAAEVAERVARGLVNDVPSAPTRTIGQIVRANVLTRFNLLLGSLLAVILVVGPLQDALFGLVIVANTLVGIVQELRAKRTLDRLEVVNAPGPGWCATGGWPSWPSARSCSTTCSRPPPATRWWSTARCWRRPGWRSTSRCSPASPRRWPASPATGCSRAASWPPGAAATGPPRSAGRPTRSSSPRRPAASPWPAPSCGPGSTRSSST